MDLETSIELINDTNLKYNYLVVKGNKNGQFISNYFKIGDTPCTRLYGSFMLLCKYESNF
jgi:3'-phosphoadenosine 5'-phosphosulfate sulfotransferase (PAPS reductase)/FAD synthetase